MFPSAWSEVTEGSLVWAALFFLLILLTGFDTVMASLEVTYYYLFVLYIFFFIYIDTNNRLLKVPGPY